MDTSDCFRREVSISESVFNMALLEGTFLFYSYADEDTEGFGAKHWRILLRFRPNTFFMISKNNYARLGPERKEVFVLFDGEDAHGGNGSCAAIFSHCTIFAKGDPLEGAHAFNGIIFFVITLQSYFLVRMG